MHTIRRISILIIVLFIISNCMLFATAASISFTGDDIVDDSILNDNTNIDPDTESNISSDSSSNVAQVLTPTASEIFQGDTTIDDSILGDNTNIDPATAATPTTTPTTRDTIDSVLKNIESNPSSDEKYTKLSQLYADKKDNGYKVFSNGTIIDFNKYDNVLPTIIDGRTMVPLRAMAESLAAKVDWNNTTKLITISLADKIVKLTINSKTATVGGASQVLDVPATVINGRTMIPLRFVGEAFGKKVGWYPNGDVKIISIS